MAMRVYYESLPSVDVDWMEPALREHFSWVHDAPVDPHFFSRVRSETFKFMELHKKAMEGLSIVWLKSMVTNSGLTFYPQLMESK